MNEGMPSVVEVEERRKQQQMLRDCQQKASAGVRAQEYALQAQRVQIDAHKKKALEEIAKKSAEGLEEVERAKRELAQRKEEINRALMDPPHEHARQLVVLSRRLSEFREMAIRWAGLNRDPAPAPSVEYLSKILHLGLLPVEAMGSNHSMMSNANVRAFVEARRADGRDPALISLEVTQTPHAIASRILTEEYERLAGTSDPEHRSRICEAPRPPTVRPRASDLADLTQLFAAREAGEEPALAPPPSPPPCPGFTWKAMQNGPKALLTRLRFTGGRAGLSVEAFITSVWVERRLPDICVEAVVFQDDDETVVICDIERRVTLSSILQHSRVEGFADPVVEVAVLDTRKVVGCPHPRKRIWEELVSRNPEGKRLCANGGT